MAQRRTIKINGYPIDLVRAEEIVYPARISKFPTESGSKFSDNIKNDPIEVSLECLVSETPIGPIAQDPTRQIVADNQGTILEGARAHLLAIREARKEFVLELTKGTFRNMGLVNLSEVANASTTGGLSFNAKFQQLDIRNNRRTRIRIATRMPNGEIDLGIVLDRLIDGQVTLWRKGAPPGRGPATIPPGIIIGQELVFCRKGKILHSDDKTPLTPGEMLVFKLDLERDSAGFQTHSQISKSQAVAKQATAAATLKRAQEYQNAQIANPGKKIDPKLFGLDGKPKALDESKIPADSPLKAIGGPLSSGVL